MCIYAKSAKKVSWRCANISGNTFWKAGSGCEAARSSDRCVKKAMAGERVMVLSRYKAEQAERLLRAFVAEDALRNKVASVHICMENGGEIVIGGVSRDCE